VLFDSELFDLRFQRRRRNPEFRRSPARASDLSATLHQGRFDQALFLILERLWQWISSIRAQWSLVRQPRLVYRKRIATAQDDRTLDNVLQLANVARPLGIHRNLAEKDGAGVRQFAF